jgi:hypothetical protein
MKTLAEVESLAFELPEQQRAALASRILDSLPPLLCEPDEGLAEAVRRDAGMDSGEGIGLEEFDRLVSRRR